MQTKQTLSYDEANMFIRNKPQMHTALGRDGWELPTLNSSLCTLDFMRAVRKRLVYCPKRDEMTIQKKCFSIPPKPVLLQTFIDAATAAV